MIKLNPLTGNFDDVGFPARTLTGTSNQVTVTNGDGVSGNPTLSLPQNIHTGASPTFAGETLNGTLNLTNSSLNSGDGNIDMPTSKGLQIRNATATASFRLLPSGNDIYFQNTVTAGAMVFSALNAADLTNDIMFKTTGIVRAYTDSVTDLGSGSAYWRNTYTDRLYLNSTFNIDGAVAGTGNITGNLGILATSGSATHSLTLGSTSTGIALYNTADQTTNYERVRLFTSGGTSYRLYAEQGGTGQAREIVISGLGISTQALALNVTSANGFVESRGTSATANAIIHRISGSLSSTSGTQYGLSIVPSLGQSSTAGYTALLINPTETTTGSGAKLLIDAQVGGTSKFKVDNTGTPELGVSGGGIVMKSPDGTRYRVTVANGGTIAVAAA